MGVGGVGSCFTFGCPFPFILTIVLLLIFIIKQSKFMPLSWLQCNYQ